VVAWGSGYYGESTVPLEAMSNVIAIAAGYQNSFALLKSGRVVAWGDNNFGLINVPSDASNNVIAIAANTGAGYALRNDGRVVAWGADDYGLLEITNAPPRIKMMAAGGLHTINWLYLGSLTSDVCIRVGIIRTEIKTSYVHQLYLGNNNWTNLIEYNIYK